MDVSHGITHEFIDQYDCKEVCVPSPSQVNTGTCSRLNSQDVVSHQQETASLSLPQINHLFEASFVRDEISVSNVDTAVMYHPLGCQKNTQEWMVDLIADLFRTTHRVTTQQVIKSRGQHCGDIEIEGYLVNESGPVSLVLDLRIAHDRFKSSSDPSLNVNLHYPHNIDRSLIETADDKIRKYHADYNNDPPHNVVFMTVIISSVSTSGRLHSDFVRLLFLQAHRETDRFFAASGVHLAESTSGYSTSSVWFSLNSFKTGLV